MMKALVIGNSNGIGLELTSRLLDLHYEVIGISKSPSSLVHEKYRHMIFDVSSSTFRTFLEETISPIHSLEICIYCAGIGNKINLAHLEKESKVFEVNLMAAVYATQVVVAKMLQQKSGHFIGLSSIADRPTLDQHPSYCASKAGISRYWESLGAALRSRRHVKVSNIRFGFVDTKMAKAPLRPFMLSKKSAVDFIVKVIHKPRIRATKPLRLDFLVWILEKVNRIRLGLFG